MVKGKCGEDEEVLRGHVLFALSGIKGQMSMKKRYTDYVRMSVTAEKADSVFGVHYLLSTSATNKG